MADGGRSPRRERIVGGSILAVMLGLFGYALFIFVLPFAFPTPPPIITGFQSTTVFSPNGDGRRDVARINIRVHEPSDVTLEVVADGEPVATLIDNKRLPRGWVRPVWDGRDDAGRVLPDGSYGLRLDARSGKKKFRKSRSIAIDTTSPTLSALAVESATLGAAGRGECRIEAVTGDEGGALQLQITRPGGTATVAHRGPLRAPSDRTTEWRWSGRSDRGGTPPPGLYLIEATLGDSAGNRSRQSASCWVGRIAGSARPAAPRPRQPVTVALRHTDGRPLPAATAVALEFRRRTATPGIGTNPPLGARVGGRYRGPLGRATLMTPAGIRPDALWLVARSADGIALIELGARP